MHPQVSQASAVYASVAEGTKALVEVDGAMLQVVVVRSGSLATRMVSILLYAILMSLLGHIVLTLLSQAFECLQQQYLRYRGRVIQLEDGPLPQDTETAQVAESREPTEKLLII
ncbi:hypothetical protein P389DRAFT_191925 [Cystobasidium minutum MCA 4210]|uniref:uncharacterized protein n=1 Tax=Cystobasidium minutum MCA 4210 TaxID=1397322 RepID=UPI0034CF5365|eukprot:jgi/Rhomi1/191925/gm1.139_g